MALVKGRGFQSTINELMTANSAMKSLAEKNWTGEGEESEVIGKAEQLRINTVDLGRMYFNFTLPNFVNVVMTTKCLFRNIGHSLFDMDEEFVERLPFLLDEIITVWQNTLREHNDMLTSMKKSKDEATKTISELDYHQKKNKKSAAILRKKAKTKDNVGNILSVLLPFLGAVFATFLWSSASGNRSEASKRTALAEKHALFSQNVKGGIIPAAESFITHIGWLAGFLNNYKAEILQLNSDTGERGLKRFSCIKMKWKAAEIVETCEEVERVLQPEFIKALSF